MLGLGALLASICVTCISQDQPTAVQNATLAPRATMTLAVGDGCARLHIRTGPGSTATVTAVDEGITCRTDELEVRVDSAPSFDEASGLLRLPIVIRNLGTTSMGVPARLTFIADSANLFDQNGNLLPGKPDILAHNADSANASGRIGVWRYDAYLAPSGQPQVLAVGATSQRRWLEFRSTDWHNAIRISLSATAQEPSPTVVPDLAPDTAPKALFDSLGIVTESGWTYVRGIVVISFLPGTSQQQRQAAVDRIGARVVGGRRSTFLDEGDYYLLLPGSGALSSILDALDSLDAFPYIETKGPYTVREDLESYRRPKDGGADWRNWALTPPQSAAKQNWALETIRAPHAWGCSIGDDAIAVGVVDTPLHSVPDLAGNIDFARSSLNTVRDLTHGVGVASLIGAVGNNDSAMTGVAWNISLLLQDRLTEPSRPGESYDFLRWSGRTNMLNSEHFVRAGRFAEIVNVSMNPKYDGSVPTTSNRSHRRASDVAMQSLMRAIRNLQQQQRQPLFVLSAGNDSSDAFFGGYGRAKSQYPDQVLVVGASTVGGTRWRPSNYGALVDIYAPGEGVYALDSLGTPIPRSGTSFSAPLVTGTAALLKSFDPRLQSALLKQFILAGSTDSLEDGTRRAPLLNAYSALRKAAERPGAPLCGNRVWAANGKLWAERSVVNGLPNDDSLATIPTGARSYVGVFHGGQRIQNLRGSGWFAFTWTPASGWGSAAPVFDDSLSGGTWWSSFGIDHDLTTRLWTRAITTASVKRIQFFTTPVFGGAETIVGTSDSIRAGTDSSTAQCIQRHKAVHSSCRQSVFTVYQPIVAQSIAPEGDRAFVAVTQARSTPILSGFISCSTDLAEPEECAPFTTVREIIGPASVYEVDLRTPQTLTRWTTSGAAFYLAVSERNDDLVASEGTYVRREFIDFFQDTQAARSFWYTASVTITGACSVVYRDIRRPAVTGSEHRRIAVEPLNGCDDPNTGRFGGGTIAPRPIPIAPIAVQTPGWRRGTR